MNATPRDPCNSASPKTRHSIAMELLVITEPLREAQVAEFGSLLDEELARLEERFADFVTRKSTFGSLRR